MISKNLFSSIKAENLTCIRGNQLVFKDLNFEFDTKKPLLIKGKNGSGKSSLLKIISQLHTPFSGKILFVTQEEQGPICDYKINYMADKNPFKNTLSVLENLIFWQKTLGKTAYQDIETAINYWDISPIKNKSFQELSMGQKRRAHLAKLMTSPDRIFWILDEPTIGLDETFSKKLLHFITTQKQNIFFVIATHDHHFLETLDHHLISL